MSDALDLEAWQLARAVRSRAVSPVEVVEQSLAAIAERDREVNSTVVVLEREARELARGAEQALVSGAPLGPLHGVPVTIKEPIWVEGAPATNGCLALKDFRAPVDAIAVARLRRAGAIIVGKTNVPEMQFRGITDNDIYGLTRNPWDLSRTPGGSSGGAAASTALGIAPLALGSDGGGSIRIPASFSGVVGLKPSRGRIPLGPSRPAAPSVSVLGPMARSVLDVTLMLRAMAGPDPADDAALGPWRPEELDADESVAWTRSRRIAYSADLGYAPCAPAVRAWFDDTIESLRADGWHLTEAHPAAGDPTACWYTIFETELHAATRALLETTPELIGDFVRAGIEAGGRVPAHAYLDAQEARKEFSVLWSRFFECHDLLLTPGAAITAFDAGIAEPAQLGGEQPGQPAKVAFAAAMLPANLTGQPALAVPGGLIDGLPIGLQIIAPRGADAAALRAGMAFEHLRGRFPMAAETAPEGTHGRP